MKYKDIISIYLPRVLTQIDRDPDSSTVGCCDRNYWHLKIRDFPSAILQQACLVLALVYKFEICKGYYENRNVHKWACGVIDYWVKIQLKDGSFNEYYPNEHGFPPTAFTLYAVAKSCLLLNYNNEIVKDAVEKAALHLLNRKETEASNQESAAIAGIFYASELLGKEELYDRALVKLNDFLKTEKKEGWFIEYGGVDFGYLSVTIDMLGEIYLLTKQKRLLEVMERCTAICSKFMMPDGTIGGNLASRNTTYMLPAGFELLISTTSSTSAMMVKEMVFNDYSNMHYIHSVDDRYLTHYVLHSFIRGAVHNQDRSYSLLAIQEILKNESEYFSQAGLLAFNCNDIKIFIAAKKGGVVRVFKGIINIFNDYGYRIVCKNDAYVTYWQSESWDVSWDPVLKEMKIRGNMFKIRNFKSSTLKHFILRLLASIFGNKIVGFLKAALVKQNKNVPILFDRTIAINQNEVKIVDKIINQTNIKHKLFKEPGYSRRLVPSGKFFARTDLVSSENQLFELENELRIEKILNFKQRLKGDCDADK